MNLFARSEANSPSNPKVQFFALQGGVLVDVEALTFSVWDISTAEKRLTPVQVVAPTSVNLVSGRLAKGRYAPTFTVPVNEAVGRHEVRFDVTFADASTRTEAYEIEVVDKLGAIPAFDFYCTPSDLTDEGFTGQEASFLLTRIMAASKLIEATTKRFFAPRVMSLKVDGKGGTKILLDHPIIAITDVRFDTTPWEPSATQLDLDMLRVYNRHLAGLTSPDDRANPKIEIFHPVERYGGGSFESSSARMLSKIVFPVGQQNVAIDGVFGYTDPDGQGGIGTLPVMLRHACKLLVVRELDKMSRTAARFDRRMRHRLTSERTRDQAYTLEPLGTAKGAFFTGDPEIDNILAYYMRPPAMGAA